MKEHKHVPSSALLLNVSVFNGDKCLYSNISFYSRGLESEQNANNKAVLSLQCIFIQPYKAVIKLAYTELLNKKLNDFPDT